MNWTVILQRLGKILTSKWFWIILGTIILYLILRRNWTRVKLWFKGNLGKDYGNYDLDGDGKKDSLSDDRKYELENLAREIHADLEIGWWKQTPTNHIAEAADSTSDTELKYLANYYKGAVTRGKSLYEDVDEETFFIYQDDADVRLMERLSTIGEL